MYLQAGLQSTSSTPRTINFLALPRTNSGLKLTDPSFYWTCSTTKKSNIPVDQQQNLQINCLMISIGKKVELVRETVEINMSMNLRWIKILLGKFLLSASSRQENKVGLNLTMASNFQFPKSLARERIGSALTIWMIQCSCSFPRQTKDESV